MWLVKMQEYLQQRWDSGKTDFQKCVLFHVRDFSRVLWWSCWLLWKRNLGFMFTDPIGSDYPLMQHLRSLNFEVQCCENLKTFTSYFISAYRNMLVLLVMNACRRPFRVVRKIKRKKLWSLQMDIPSAGTWCGLCWFGCLLKQKLVFHTMVSVLV